jgi:purine-nucleoside phosphorylase
METLEKKIQDTTYYLLGKTKLRPRIGIILGTGLKELVSTIEAECNIHYKEIPHFPHTTVESHVGNLVFGILKGKAVIVMQGRFHCYEGYSPQEVAFPVWVMRNFGIKYLIIVNAAGGLNPNFGVGDIMIITDHINLTGLNPLVGLNMENIGGRFPDMSEPYSRELIQLALDVSSTEKMEVRKGVYVGVLGPSLETVAETRFLRMIGADAVGMSTIPEVIAAAHCKIKVLGLSVISNLNLPGDLKPFSIEEVIKTVERVTPRLVKMIHGIVEKLEVEELRK